MAGPHGGPRACGVTVPSPIQIEIQIGPSARGSNDHPARGPFIAAANRPPAAAPRDRPGARRPSASAARR